MIYRAYSVLDVKTFDPVTRTIAGVATTPTADRLGDVIDPRGATFANPLPLLLYHDARRPVGSVDLDAPTDAGINFRASLPTVAEPGTLRDRVDEAWQSVKAGLLRGVSIGFRALDGGIERLKGGDGLRFTKIEVLELSLVAIPANAEARIDVIKALDAPHLDRSTRPMNATPTTLEQIQGFSSMRTAKAARMSELMTTAGAAGVVLDEPQSAEYDALQDEVERLDKHLARLSILETTNRAAAVPAAGTSMRAAADSRAADSRAEAAAATRIYLRDNLPPGIAFARMVICKLVAFQNQFSVSPLEVAKARYPDQHEIHQYFERAAVPASTTQNQPNAGVLVQPSNLTSEFLAWLRPQTIIGKFGTGNVPNLRAVPFNVAITGQISGGAGYWVGEGKAKPLTNFTFDRQTLGWSKVAAISVITEELARFSSPSAEALVRDGLRDALVARLDIDFVDPAHAAVANVTPASITNGLTPLTSTAGMTADSVRHDLQALLNAFITSNANVADLVLIIPNTIALGLSLMTNAIGNREFPGLGINGGELAGIPVITSQYANTAASGDMAIAVNAQLVGLADDGAVAVEASREASLEMSDAPTGDSLTPTGSQLVSMWQTNSIALKAERFINWKKLRTGAVVYMDHLDWAPTTGS